MKSGKEATVYCCAADACRDVRFYALKLYTPPDQRSFRNAAVYQETRFNRSTRQGRAMHNKSSKGRSMLQGQWLSHEFNALKTLFEAGCDVPQPIANGDRALLLTFVASDDDEGQAAPPLATKRLRGLTPNLYWRRRNALLKPCCVATSCTVICLRTIFSLPAENCM